MRAFVDALELCTIAVSLGEPTTLVWPLRDGLIRLAVGLEDPADLETDLERGLEAAAAVGERVPAPAFAAKGTGSQTSVE